MSADAFATADGLISTGRAVPCELLLARTEAVALLVRRVTAYPGGFSFVFEIRLREAHRGSLEHDRARATIRLRVEMGGRTLDARFPGQTGAGQRLRMLEAGGTAALFISAFAADGLPTEGEVRFVCDWPPYDIHNAVATLAAAALIEAAERSTPLWNVRWPIPGPPE